MVIQLYYLYKTSAFIAIKHVNILMHFTFYYNCLNLNSLKSDSIVYTLQLKNPTFFFTQNKSCKLAQAYYFFFLIRKKKVYIFACFYHIYTIYACVFISPEAHSESRYVPVHACSGEINLKRMNVLYST